LRREHVEARGEDNGLAIHIATGLLKFREIRSAGFIKTPIEA
jgi:hypothetical protein